MDDLVVVKEDEVKDGWKACSTPYHKATNRDVLCELVCEYLQVMPPDIREITKIK